jgi:hypothetical protein
VEEARDPNDPELNHEVGVVTRLQAKKMAQPYSKLKVPDIISHVSVDDIYNGFCRHHAITSPKM